MLPDEFMVQCLTNTVPKPHTELKIHVSPKNQKLRDGYRWVVQTSDRWEDKTSQYGRTVSWNRTLIKVIVLECGHVQERRGYCQRVPKQAKCAECFPPENHWPLRAFIEGMDTR